MPSLPRQRPLPASPRAPMLDALFARLPGQCLMCRSWQARPLCATCLAHWLPDVRRCPRCALAFTHMDGAGHCRACDDETPEFDRAVAALDYVAPWTPLIARMKFQNGTALARPLGALLARAVAPRRGRVSLVLPVPLSRERLVSRGFNQSWLLARQVAARLGLQARHDLLARTRHTERLMAMSAEERQQEIEDVFQATAAGRDWLRGRHVAIVDDVMTTGATLNAATRALLDGGASSVSAWVLARTPAPSSKARDASDDPDGPARAP